MVVAKVVCATVGEAANVVTGAVTVGFLTTLPYLEVVVCTVSVPAGKVGALERLTASPDPSVTPVRL